MEPWSMSKHERSRFVEQLLKEELESVTLGLEQGTYSREEIDLPHDSEGCTPLISACRRGLTRVMHFLLERGADATLSNYSNQTALHVCQPTLQGELMMAMIRNVPHQRQLSLAAWSGDLSCLQDMMARTDLDLNTQNRDGLTALMLAVRDVDLFEGLEMPWDYQPVEVVKKLMSLAVDMEVVDLRGHTALWYISQIKSTKKEDLFRIMESSMQTVFETIFTCQDVPYWPTSPDVHSSCCPTCGCCTPVSDEMKKEPAEIIIVHKNHADIHQDKICFEGCMESKMEIRQDGRDERKQSSRTSSLPSLWNSRQNWGKIRPLRPSLSLTSSIVPVLPSAHATHLSKSAPMLMDPLLDASVLLQARANINNRLRAVDTGDENNRQKTPPTLCLRTPKHLAPLDNRYTDGSARSSLEHPLLLKQSSILSISPRKLEMISSQSSRRSRGTRAGSEESNSCSSSSQEEDETVPQDEHKIHVGLEKSLNFELGTCLDLQDLVSSVINNTTKDKNNVISDNSKDYTAIGSLTVREVEAEYSKDLHRECPTIDCCSISKVHKSIVGEIQPSIRSSCVLAGEKHFTTADISVVERTTHEKNKPVKTTKGNDRTGKTSIQTNQSFNVLAHRNQSTVKTIRKRINSPIQSKLQLRESKSTGLVIAGETTNKYLPRAPAMSCKRTADVAPTTKMSETFQHMTSSDDKKVSNNSQKQIHRDQRSAKAFKKPVSGAAQRARSAVDYVTYNDMFLKISQGDEGPAIYEMFATPIYENLRADSSAEREKQVHTTLQVKRQINGKPRGQKTVEINRRKQAQSERSSRVKCRHLKRRDNINKGIKKHQPSPSENKLHVIVTSACETIQQKKSEMPVIREMSSVERQCTSILSVIEEVLSDTLPKTNLIKDIIHQEQTKVDAVVKSELEIRLTRLPTQPLVNTWTSDGTVSPVHQRFLDEASDGPLTDDLLRSLADELFSLERREVETLKTEKEDGTEFKHNLPSKFKTFLNEGVSSGELRNTIGSCSHDAITWTKGEVLGKGAYGTVYCGLTSQGQLIAVKQVALDASTSKMAEKEYDRLEREVDLLKNLHHINIIGFLGTALCGNTVSIFMEYVPGGSISNILSRFGPLPEKVFVLYTQQILEGVAYLHANRVIHRDLKGNNIMLMPTGVIKLIDFGCAHRLSCLQTSNGSKSDLLKSVHGTPYWMAPEVISESGHGRKSDIWSIGCTVFEMATGKPPLAHMNKMAALFYIGARKGLMPTLSDDFSTHAKHFVQACLTRDPRQRPSAEELLRHPLITAKPAIDQ